MSSRSPGALHSQAWTSSTVGSTSQSKLAISVTLTVVCVQVIYDQWSQDRLSTSVIGLSGAEQLVLSYMYSVLMVRLAIGLFNVSAYKR